MGKDCLYIPRDLRRIDWRSNRGTEPGTNSILFDTLVPAHNKFSDRRSRTCGRSGPSRENSIRSNDLKNDNDTLFGFHRARHYVGDPRILREQPPIGIEVRLVENRALANRKHSSQFGFKRTSPFEANLGDPFRTSSSNRYGDLICQFSETLEQFAITARGQNEGSR